MKLGAFMFSTDLSMPPADAARAIEDRGFESFFVPEHTHIPTGRKTPFPGGEPLPEEYRRTNDPFVALAMAAAVTTDLRLGTGICLVAQHDPIVLAKTVATVDALSGGRLLFGIGFGWNEDEMEDHGVDPKLRRTITREKTLAMKALWTQDEASFEGRHVHVQPTWSWPKPVSKPHPPVIIGGRPSKTVLHHVVDYADGWMPIDSGFDAARAVREVRSRAEEAGRDPSTIELTAFGARASEDRLTELAEAGFARAIFGLPPAKADVVLPVLDRRAALLATVKA